MAAPLLVALVAGDACAAGAHGPKWVSHPDQPFDIEATEVAVKDFRACVAAGRCEPSSVNPECNYGDPKRGDHPINCIDHDGAIAVCDYLGGRLCSSKEWLAACHGSDGRAFPYGSEYQPSRCHVGTYDVPGPGGRTTIPVGSVPDCEGGLHGLFDMSGNVSEWISDCKGDYCKFRGAAFVGNDPVEHFAGCAEVCAGNDKGLKSSTVGVRCCRDRSASAPKNGAKAAAAGGATTTLKSGAAKGSRSDAAAATASRPPASGSNAARPASGSTARPTGSGAAAPLSSSRP
ncbi:MAG TPA: SUMF1/EgtB/PvdO family nonheme iron enzyme [Candidatus Binatia bacterium]